MNPDPINPAADQPTVEEALPGVDLTPDPKTEEISRETLGPDAVETTEEAKIRMDGEGLQLNDAGDAPDEPQAQDDAH